MTDHESEFIWAEIDKGQEISKLESLYEAPEYPHQPMANFFATMLRRKGMTDDDLSSALENYADEIEQDERSNQVTFTEALRIKARRVREGENHEWL